MTQSNLKNTRKAEIAFCQRKPKEVGGLSVFKIGGWSIEREQRKGTAESCLWVRVRKASDWRMKWSIDRKDSREDKRKLNKMLIML